MYFKNYVWVVCLIISGGFLFPNQALSQGPIQEYGESLFKHELEDDSKGIIDISKQLEQIQSEITRVMGKRAATGTITEPDAKALIDVFEQAVEKIYTIVTSKNISVYSVFYEADTQGHYKSNRYSDTIIKKLAERGSLIIHSINKHKASGRVLFNKDIRAKILNMTLSGLNSTLWETQVNAYNSGTVKSERKKALSRIRAAEFNALSLIHIGIDKYKQWDTHRKKHETFRSYKGLAMIYKAYVVNYPNILRSSHLLANGANRNLLLSRFINTITDMGPREIEACYDAIDHYYTPAEVEEIINFYANNGEGNKRVNTHNQSFVYKALRAGVDIEYVIRFHRIGGNFFFEDHYDTSNKKRGKTRKNALSLYVYQNIYNHHKLIEYSTKEKTDLFLKINYILNHIKLSPSNSLFYPLKDYHTNNIEKYTYFFLAIGFSREKIKHTFKDLYDRAGDKKDLTTPKIPFDFVERRVENVLNKNNIKPYNPLEDNLLAKYLKTSQAFNEDITIRNQLKDRSDLNKVNLFLGRVSTADQDLKDIWKEYVSGQCTACGEKVNVIERFNNESKQSSHQRKYYDVILEFINKHFLDGKEKSIKKALTSIEVNGEKAKDKNIKVASKKESKSLTDINKYTHHLLASEMAIIQSKEFQAKFSVLLYHLNQSKSISDIYEEYVDLNNKVSSISVLDRIIQAYGSYLGNSFLDTSVKYKQLRPFLSTVNWHAQHANSLKIGNVDSYRSKEMQGLYKIYQSLPNLQKNKVKEQLRSIFTRYFNALPSLLERNELSKVKNFSKTSNKASSSGSANSTFIPGLTMYSFEKGVEWAYGLALAAKKKSVGAWDSFKGIIMPGSWSGNGGSRATSTDGDVGFVPKHTKVPSATAGEPVEVGVGQGESGVGPVPAEKGGVPVKSVGPQAGKGPSNLPVITKTPGGNKGYKNGNRGKEGAHQNKNRLEKWMKDILKQVNKTKHGQIVNLYNNFSSKGVIKPEDAFNFAIKAALKSHELGKIKTPNQDFNEMAGKTQNAFRKLMQQRLAWDSYVAAKGPQLAKAQLDFLCASWIILSVRKVVDEGMPLDQALVSSFAEILNGTHLKSLGVFVSVNTGVSILSDLGYVKHVLDKKPLLLSEPLLRFTRFMIGRVGGLGLALLGMHATLEMTSLKKAPRLMLQESGAHGGLLSMAYYQKMKKETGEPMSGVLNGDEINELVGKAKWGDYLPNIDACLQRWKRPEYPVFSQINAGAILINKFRWRLGTDIKFKDKAELDGCDVSEISYQLDAMDYISRLSEAFFNQSFVDTLVTVGFLFASHTISSAAVSGAAVGGPPGFAVGTAATVLMLSMVGVMEWIYKDVRYGVHDREDYEREKSRMYNAFDSHKAYIEGTLRAPDGLLSREWMRDVEEATEHDYAFMLDHQKKYLMRSSLLASKISSVFEIGTYELREIHFRHNPNLKGSCYLEETGKCADILTESRNATDRIYNDLVGVMGEDSLEDGRYENGFVRDMAYIFGALEYHEDEMADLIEGDSGWVGRVESILHDDGKARWESINPMSHDREIQETHLPLNVKLASRYNAGAVFGVSEGYRDSVRAFVDMGPEMFHHVLMGAMYMNTGKLMPVVH